MANLLVLPPQKFRYKDIADQFPSTATPKKKVFFQAELRSLADGNARFGIVAYPCWNDGRKWVVGKKISGSDFGEPRTVPFTDTVAFANNEVFLSFKQKKKSRKKDLRRGKWNALEKYIQKSCKKISKSSMDNATLLFEASISANPHLEYNVTIDNDGPMLSAATKPSPPAPPEA